MNSLVLAAAIMLAARYFALESLSYRLLAITVFYYAQIILIQLFWGIIAKLYLPYIFVLVLAIFLASLFLCKKKFVPLRFSSQENEFTSNKIALFCLSILLGFALVKIAINLVNPPFGWDSLNYHFSFPVQWLKQGNLCNPITINDDIGPPYYPINGSLIYLWFMLPLKNVFLADIGQVPFFLISFLAVYGICRQLKITKEYSFYAAGIFTLTPNYFKQLEISYVDVMVCGWFSLGVYFLLLFYQQKRFKDVSLCAVSIGILMGTKTTALLYAAVLGLLFFIALFSKMRELGYKKILLYSSIFCFLIVIFGGYGYIRNFIQTGNPLYPAKVEFLGKEIFKGVYAKNNYSVRVNPRDYSLEKILFHEGMGSGLLVLVIPGFLLFIYHLIRRTLKADMVFLFFIPVALCLLWRFVIPLPNLRYLYPGLAMSYIIPFYFFSSQKPYRTIIRALIVIVSLASCFEIAVRLELIFSLLTATALFFSLNRMYDGALAYVKVKHWIFMFFLLYAGLYFLNNDYNKNEFSRYPKMTKYSGLWPDAAKAWRWLNENTTGNNIAYVGRPVPFPLYGVNFKNNVFYVSVNEIDPIMVHYLPNSFYSWGPDFLELHKSFEAEGNYRQHPRYDTWLNNLKRRKADYLFVYSLHQTKETMFPLEDSWAKNNPSLFSEAFRNATIHIYKIRY